MLLGELSKRVGRSRETIRRWIDDDLLQCDRDALNRRVFGEEHVERCLELARLAISAQLRNVKLSDLAAASPAQLTLSALQGVDDSPTTASPNRRARDAKSIDI